MYNCRSSARQSCGNIFKSDFSVFRKSTCVPYLSPTSPAKAKSITALRGNISDHRWLGATGCCVVATPKRSMDAALLELPRCHGNLTPMWFSQSRPHCDVCGWTEVSLSSETVIAQNSCWLPFGSMTLIARPFGVMAYRSCMLTGVGRYLREGT